MIGRRTQAARRRAKLAATTVAITTILLGLAGTARATSLSAERADDDVKALRDDGRDGFCSAPPERLSEHAAELCPMAKEVAGCEALVARCKGEVAEKPKAPDVSFLEKLGPIAQVLMWVLIAVMIVGIGYPLLLAILKARRDQAVADPEPDAPRPSRAPPPEELPDETEAEVLMLRAEEHRRRGDHARAIFAYLHASLRALDRREQIRIAPFRTHGEYVRACRDQAARAELRAIVREVEEVRFGGATATDETSSRVASRAALLVRGLPLTVMTVTMLLALVLGLVGCGSSGPKLQRANDPAGDDLFLELLPKQGVKLSKERGALSSLPLPKAGEKEPALIVDLARVPLDDDSRDHLLKWVKAGGVLVIAAHGPWKALGYELGSGDTSELTVPPLDLGTVDINDDEVWVDESPNLEELHGGLATPRSLVWEDATPLARVGKEPYAMMKLLGKGRVIVLADDQLFTNLGLARHGNAGALVALLSHMHRHEARIARPEDGTSPPTSPFSSLMRAGMGLGLWHALAAVFILFIAVGTRAARPTPTPPPQRRAFTEHVEATGALYARTKMAPHALAAYTRWVDERLRAQMPRGGVDLAAWVAHRAKEDEASVRATFARAQSAQSDEKPRGDELIVLKKLGNLYAAATADGNVRRRS